MDSVRSPVVSAPPQRRRWPRRVLLLILVFVGVPAAYYFYTRHSLDAEIARAVAETDALDPRWRLADLEAERKTHRDEDNSALHIIKVRRMITGPVPGGQKDHDEAFKDLPPCTRLNLQQLEMIRAAFDQYPEALIEARKLKDMPQGRFKLTITPDFIGTLLPNHQDGREIAGVLYYDAMLRAQGGDPEAALESAAAILNIGRVYGDEPFIISLLIRMVCARLLVESVERTLAQGHPKEESLQALQQRLALEPAELRARWIDVIRGERAGQHEFFEAVHGRKLRLGEYMVTTMRMRIPLPHQIANNLIPELYTKDYPQHLRHMNALVAAARLPLEEQLDRFVELAQSVDRSDRRKADLAQVLPLFPPDLTKACQTHLRAQANLAATGAALACERFRLRHQRWPNSLAELVKTGMLDTIPTDPFDGQPLRLAFLKDGLAIYSVGADRQDDGGSINRDNPLDPRGDHGFRLWNPQARRQAPRPPVALPR